MEHFITWFANRTPRKYLSSFRDIGEIEQFTNLTH